MIDINAKKKRENKIRRKTRGRARIRGVAEKPRLSVFRSNTHLYLQLIDDTSGTTLLASSDLSSAAKGKKAERAFEVGKTLALKAKAKGIVKAVFDRGSYLYHGRIKSAADGAREGGLQF